MKSPPPEQIDAPPRLCSIDRDPNLLAFVAEKHLEGNSLAAIERLSREWPDGRPIKAETIGRHLRECVQTTVTGKVVAQAAQQVRISAADQHREDVAVLVQAAVVEKLRDGDARVTVRDGLTAQSLLDKRAERQKDRELSITLARLLHAPPPPPEVITVRGESVAVISENAFEDVAGVTRENADD